MEGLVDVNHFESLQKILCWLITKTLLLWGVKEHSELSFKVLQFVFYENKKSYLYKRPMIQILSIYDKIYQLNNSHHTDRDSSVRNIHICDADDPMDLYILLCKYRKICPPEEDRFYCYPLSPLLQKEVMNIFPGVSDVNLILSNRNRPIGKNIINGFCKDLAKSTG